MLKYATDKELMKLTKENLIAIIRDREDIIKRYNDSHIDDYNERKRLEYQNDFNTDIIKSLLRTIENLSQNTRSE